MMITCIEIIFNMTFSQELTVLILLGFFFGGGTSVFFCILVKNLFQFNTYTSISETVSSIWEYHHGDWCQMSGGAEEKLVVDLTFKLYDVKYVYLKKIDPF